MKKYIHLLIRIFLVLSMFFVGIMFYKNLPNMMPTHWNVDGQIDGFSPKNMFAFIFPIATLLMIGSFKLFQSMDPRKERYENFKKEWEIIQTSITAFMTYMYFITIYLSFNQSQKIEPLLFIGMGILFMVIGACLGKVKQNYFVGFKFPWTLDNEEVWDKTNKLGGYMFMILGLIFLAESYFVWNPAYVIFPFLLLVIFIPIIYSYILYKKTKK